MNFSVKNISLTFAAGCVGGLANILVVWLFGVGGITKALNVLIAPPFSTPWLYNRLVWGGLWAFLFLLSRRNLSFPARGLVYSLGRPWRSCLLSFLSRLRKACWACNWAT